MDNQERSFFKRNSLHGKRLIPTCLCGLCLIIQCARISLLLFGVVIILVILGLPFILHSNRPSHIPMVIVSAKGIEVLEYGIANWSQIKSIYTEAYGRHMILYIIVNLGEKQDEEWTVDLSLLSTKDWLGLIKAIKQYHAVDKKIDGVFIQR